MSNLAAGDDVAAGTESLKVDLGSTCFWNVGGFLFTSNANLQSLCVSYLETESLKMYIAHCCRFVLCCEWYSYKEGGWSQKCAHKNTMFLCTHEVRN